MVEDALHFPTGRNLGMTANRASRSRLSKSTVAEKLLQRRYELVTDSAYSSAGGSWCRPKPGTPGAWDHSLSLMWSERSSRSKSKVQLRLTAPWLPPVERKK